MSFAPDSELVRVVRPSRGFRRGKYVQRDRSRIVAIVNHTTGMGPVRRFLDEKQRRRHGWRDPFEAALWIYENVMDAGPHYVVGQEEGQIAQVCPEDRAAWHVGGKGGRAYRREGWMDARTEWWHDLFPGMGSPRELAGGRLWLPYDPAPSLLEKLRRSRWTAWREAGSVNANTDGIEVVPPEDGGPWSDACWRNLVELHHDLADRHVIPLDSHHVVSHSIAHPLSRSTADGRPWDPPSTQWTWVRFAQRAGQSVWCPPP